MSCSDEGSSSLGGENGPDEQDDTHEDNGTQDEDESKENVPYLHVVPTDVGQSIGVGSVAEVPTTSYDGPLQLDQSVTIENVRIDGCLDIQAPNVTLRNVVVDCDGLYPIHAQPEGSGLSIENSQIVCRSRSKAFYVQNHADAKIVANEITGCEDFFFIGGDIGELLIERNYMHSLNLSSESHADGFQIGEAQTTTGTITIRGNNIDPAADGGKNDAIFATNQNRSSLVIESNYFHVWGLRTIRCMTEETRCAIRYNVYDDAFRTVQTSAGKRLFVMANTAEPVVFECNRYPDGSFVEENDIVDRVAGGEHLITGCPDLESR